MCVCVDDVRDYEGLEHEWLNYWTIGEEEKEKNLLLCIMYNTHFHSCIYKDSYNCIKMTYSS